MEEKAPTRQVGYRGPDGSVTYITQPKKWINPTDKTTEQVLLEIGESIVESTSISLQKKEDIEDLLHQAADILWREFQDRNHSLYRFIQGQVKSIGEYNKQGSQVKKDYLVKDIAKESRFRINHYFETGE